MMNYFTAKYQKILKEKGRDGGSSSSRLDRGAQDFRTPRPASHTRVIHKERLNLPSGGGGARSVSPGRSGFSASGSTSRLEAAPVAHVHPHPSSPGVSSRRSLPSTATASGRISAPPGFDQPSFEVDRLARVLADSRLSDPTRPSIDALWGKPLERHRSASQDNLLEETRHQGGLFTDEPSVLDPSQLRDTENAYKSMPRSASAIPQLGTSESNIRPSYRDRDSYDMNVPRLSATSMESLSSHVDILDKIASTQQPPYSYEYGSAAHTGMDRPPTYGAGYVRDLPRTAAYDGTRLYPHYDGSYGVRDDMYGAQVEADNLPSEFMLWYQRQMEQLRKQKLEVSRSLYNQRSRSLTHIPHDGTASGTPVNDPHSVDPSIQFAEDIIREKDCLIDELQLRIVHHNQDHGSQFGDDSYGSVHGHVGRNLHTGTAAELEKKLGRTEYEFMEYKKQTGKQIQDTEDKLTRLEALVNSQESDVTEWKEKYEKVVKEQESSRQEFDRYLSDVPAPKEWNKIKKEMHSLKESKTKYKARFLELEVEMAEAKKAIRSRQDLVDSVEEGNKQLELQIEQLRKENKMLQEQLHSDVEMAEIRQENEELKERNERLKADCGKARKLLESQHKKLQAGDARHQIEKREAEERLSQEEATVMALRDEVTGKDEMLVRLRESAKELGSQNQDLMSKNLQLQDRVKELEKQHNAEAVKLQQWLLRELSVCFSELEALVQVCIQRAEGQDPNISVLLGPKPSGSSETQHSGAADSTASMQHKVKRVKELRKNVDDLRGLIANKYAEDMGDNLTCASQ